MEFDDNSPIYIQVMNMLKRQILSGKLQSNDKLPSVRQLAVCLKVNPNTIQRTYQELEKEGFTIVKPGLGRYVTDNIMQTEVLKAEMCEVIIDDFVEKMKGLGFSKQEMIQMLESDLLAVENKVDKI